MNIYIYKLSIWQICGLTLGVAYLCREYVTILIYLPSRFIKSYSVYNEKLTGTNTPTRTFHCYIAAPEEGLRMLCSYFNIIIRLKRQQLQL